MKISIQTSLTLVKHLAQVSELYLLNYFLTSFQTILCKKKPEMTILMKIKTPNLSEKNVTLTLYTFKTGNGCIY